MLIRGERQAGEILVTVESRPLDWQGSLAVRNHSPPGPAWGYGGSGSAQLAPAILLTPLATRKRPERFIPTVQAGRPGTDLRC